MTSEKDNDYRVVLRGYMKSTTIHGVQELADNNIRSKRGCTWMLLIFLMVISLITVVSYEVYQFFQYPTLTKVDTKVAKSVQFPAVTICNLNQYKLSGSYPPDIAELVWDMSEVKWLLPKLLMIGDPISSPFRTSGDYLQSVANANYHNVSVKHCVWKTGDCPQPVSRVTEFGRCKTYSGDANHTWVVTKPGAEGGLRIIINIHQEEYYFSKTLQMGIKIILHEPDEEPFPETREFIVGPGQSAVATLRRNKEVSLPHPYVSLSGDSCIDTRAASFQNKLERFSTYTYESCMKECLLNKREEKCGCRRFFDPGNKTLCSVLQMKCHIDISIDVDAQNCSCSVPCVQSWYDYSLSYADMSSEFLANYMVTIGLANDSDYLRKNMIDLTIYYDKLVIHSVEQIPQKNMEDILGTLGGIMGLFIGASLLSLVQLIELLLAMVYTCLFRKRGNITRIEVSSASTES